jgi:hypothetical protein
MIEAASAAFTKVLTGLLDFGVQVVDLILRR